MRNKVGEEGSTLLEVVLVVVLLGFGVSAVAILFSANLRAGESNREYLACAILITDAMERLRSLPVNGTTETGNIVDLAGYLSTNQGSLFSFYAYLGVDPPASVFQAIPEVPYYSTLTLSEDSGGYRVELNIRWKETMQPVRLVTYVVEGGINDLLQSD